MDGTIAGHPNADLPFKMAIGIPTFVLGGVENVDSMPASRSGRSSIQRTEDDDDLLRNRARESGCLPAIRRTAPVSRAQIVKGGTQVRSDTENYPMTYLMCVLYALVVIVLAAVFLL
jgi:hypothetical protein